MRRRLCVLIPIALLGSLGLGSASAEETPHLSDRTYFAATGSAQGRFILDHDAVLEETRGWVIGEDARIVTEGSWAALVIQRIGPYPRETVAFIKMKQQCGPGLDSICLDEEVIAVGTPFAEDPGTDPEPRYALRSGTYVVAILGDIAARTTAMLALTGPVPGDAIAYAQEDAERVVLRELEPLLTPRFELSAPTDATLQVTQRQDISYWDGAEGELETDLVSEGLLAHGYHITWDSSEERTGTFSLKSCLEWAGGTESRCGSSGGTSSGSPVVGSSSNRTGRTRMGLAPAGGVRWNWKWHTNTRLAQSGTWLLAWPYVAL